VEPDLLDAPGTNVALNVDTNHVVLKAEIGDMSRRENEPVPF
jgi:hypothetical protein